MIKNNKNISPSLWLTNNASLIPHELALIEINKTWTNSELKNYVDLMVQQLLHYGILPSTTVAVSCNSKLLLMTLIHALPIIGCPVLPLKPGLVPNLWQQFLTIANVGCIITDEVTTNEKVLIIDATKLQINVTHIKKLYTNPRALELDDIQLFIATSGSTAIPKAVMLTGRNIAAAVAASLERIPLMPNDRWLLCLPLYHIGGISIIHRCAESQATVVMLDNHDSSTIAQFLITHHCTHISLVPAMLARLLDVMPIPPRYLKYVLIGGAALNPTLAQRALANNWPLCISYGMSETCSQIATLCNPSSNWPGQLVGLPLSGIQVRIDHATNRIQVRGNILMAGYANPQHYLGVCIEEDGWFTTSDLGYIDTSGQLWVTGRADQVLNSGGIKIHPEQVENLLKNCPGITEVAISGWPDSIWGELIVAIFAGTVEICAVETWCRQHLHSSMRPREFIKVDSLPRTTLEKLDRVALNAIIVRYS